MKSNGTFMFLSYSVFQQDLTWLTIHNLTSSVAYIFSLLSFLYHFVLFYPIKGLVILMLKTQPLFTAANWDISDSVFSEVEKKD